MRKISLILALILIIASLGCVPSGIAFAAAETVGSNVLDDLHIDETFDESKYPANEKDYSLNVFQLAESDEGELLIYVYQPSGDVEALKASSITLARAKDNSSILNFANYKLTFLNSSGVFFKYKITNFELLDSDVRIYNVASISRPYNVNLDGEPASGSITEKTYPVSKMWTATTKDENVDYTVDETDVVEITDEFIGHVSYSDGFKMSFGGMTSGVTNAHFVAFSTDHRIDDLLEVKIEFYTKDFTYKYCTNILHSHYNTNYDRTAGTAVKHEPIIKKADDAVNHSFEGGINFSGQHKWKRIMTPKEFVDYHNNEDSKITTKGNANILNKQWVLSFYETQTLMSSDKNPLDFIFTFTRLSLLWKGENTIKETEVSDVMILQLTFQTKGQTYNLGVVNNRQTGDKEPVNEVINQVQQVLNQITAFFKRLGDLFVQYWWVIALILGVLVIGVLSALFKPFAKGVWWVLKILFYIITLPVWIVIWIVRAIKKGRDRNG